MMQALGVSLDVIDKCQNHIIAGSKVRRHYLHYDYAKEKREAWNRLGQKIERILSDGSITSSAQGNSDPPQSEEDDQSSPMEKIAG